jgi:hypothetical protein
MSRAKIAWTPFRSPVDPIDPSRFASWVRETRGSSGVYLIRSREGGWLGGGPTSPREIVYIGESHTERLYQTLTRHFQQWSSPSNVIYERERVDVSIALLDGPDAIVEQDRQILRWTPRDNARLPF